MIPNTFSNSNTENDHSNIKVILSADGSIVTVTSEAVLTFDGIEHFLLMTQINDGELIETVEEFKEIRTIFFKQFVSELSGYRMYKLKQEAKDMMWSPHSEAYVALEKAFSKLEPTSLFAFIEANFHIDDLDKYQILSIKRDILQDADEAEFLEGCSMGIDYSYDYNNVCASARSCWTSMEYSQMELRDIYAKYCPILEDKTKNEPYFSSASEDEYESTVEAVEEVEADAEVECERQ